jgi:AcrR family transcriptional regulator
VLTLAHLLTRVHYLGVTFELPTMPPAVDRRVRRSRAALLAAVVTLVAERGTAAVPISDIAEAADVSRQVVYLRFGDRDALLLEAALDLARRELLPRVADAPDTSAGRARALAVARHFADHRPFYRALLTSSCAFALNKVLTGLLLPVNRQVVRQLYGERLDAHAVEDVALFVTGGWAAFVNTWVIEGGDPLDPEEFTDRLMRTAAVLTTATGGPPTRRSTTILPTARP